MRWMGLASLMVGGALSVAAHTVVAQEVAVQGPQAGGVQGQVGGVQLQRQPPGPTGSVTGRVMCGDTQRPARFAQVTLRRVPGDGASGGGGNGGGFGIGGTTVQTALDGTFLAEGLAAGDYFVSANAVGYVAERQRVQAEVNAGMSLADILAKLPVVHVTANGISSVNVTMDRGGLVAGQVQWEDGSAATGVMITPVSTATAQELPAMLQGVPFYGTTTAMTDDRGRFRVAGLPAGEYVVRASLRGPQPAGTGQFVGPGQGTERRGNFSSQITVYAPGVFRKGEATAVTVKMGEERDDVRLVINLGSLRTVSGHVGVVTGPAPTAGRVSLTDTNDRTINLNGMMGANGDFSVGYVPPGTYALQVSAGVVGGQGRGGGGQNAAAAARYQPVTQTVVVGATDVTGTAITLAPVQAAP